MRRIIAVVIVVGLAIGVVLFWPRSAATDPSVTLAAPSTTEASPTTTTTATEATSTSIPPTTSTTDGEGHVIQSVEEAEEMLRDLWFGWFEGIYNEDEDRIREVVVLEETVETATESFGVMDFSGAPNLDLVQLDDVEILESTVECIAIWAALDVSGFRPDAVGTSGVYIIRQTKQGWKLLSVWANRNDLWEADCASRL